MIWDGTEFFSHDIKKVPRLEGVEPKWTDKFTSWETTPMLIISFIVMLLITISETGKWWHQHQKSQTVQLQPEIAYNYTVAESIPIIGANYFYVDKLFPKIRAFQSRNRWNKKKF